MNDQKPKIQNNLQLQLSWLTTALKSGRGDKNNPGIFASFEYATNQVNPWKGAPADGADASSNQGKRRNVLSVCVAVCVTSF